VWQRPPARNQACLHAVCSVLISGIAWRMLPGGFPSSKTVQRRLKVWLQRDTFRTAWTRLAEQDERLQGLHGDQIRRDGSKKPATKGVHRPGRRQSIVPSAARPCP
jgi:transposase